MLRYYMPIRMANIKTNTQRADDVSAKDVEQPSLSPLLMGMPNPVDTLENRMRFLIK